MGVSAIRIQDKDSGKRLSVVESTSVPGRYGIVLVNPDGSPITGGGGGGGGGNVVGPSTSVAGNIAVFGGTTGKSIKDGGFSVVDMDNRIAVLEADIDTKATKNVDNTGQEPEGMAGDIFIDAQTGDIEIKNTEGWVRIPTETDIPGVIDNLTSDSSDDALSAKQGKVLNDSIGDINSDIGDINDKIPAQATSTNKLADKDFVNSSINSITAFYITKDAQGTQFATYAELSAATTFYSGGEVRVPTRNDYCIVQEDETKDNATTRYIYQNGQREFQYVVNETALTAEQLAALNSGITSGLVDTYNGYTTSKQDALVSGTNIKTINGTSVLGNGNIAVQDVLVSGTNIKTINGNSLVGSGNVNISGLPTQTGNGGKFLTTNGTSASWNNPVQVMTQDEYDSITPVNGIAYFIYTEE